tara:strand:- start:2297 stop:2515 length:219 start_codon:yes stop_codon:yes gene_type:complete
MVSKHRSKKVRVAVRASDAVGQFAPPSLVAASGGVVLGVAAAARRCVPDPRPPRPIARASTAPHFTSVHVRS